jgi:hypothetical protein
LIEPGTKLTIPDLQKNLNNTAARGEIKNFLKDVAGVYDQKVKRGDVKNQKAYDDFQTRLTALSNSL